MSDYTQDYVDGHYEGYHKRDKEVAELAAEIERLRGLLREWLDRPGIIEHPTWRKAFDERVRKALGEKAE